jgi:hypothetical protein
MPNGKPGDHPYTDIVHWKKNTYSPLAADLVREIAKLTDQRGRDQLADLLTTEYDDHSHPDVAKLERVLTEMRDKLLKEARERDFET